MRWLVVGLSVLVAALPVHAHPVPKNSYDRTIVVRVQKADAAGRLRVQVDYRLEVDETTVVLEDMKPYRDEVDILQYRGKILDYYAEFTRIYAPVYADNLVLKINGKRLLLEPGQRTQRLHDEKGEPLGHLRCEFRFAAEFAVAAVDEVKLSFKEHNYEFYEGKVLLSAVNEAGVHILAREEPSEELKKREAKDFQVGDQDRLRSVLWRFKMTATPVVETAVPPPASETQSTTGKRESFLFKLFFHGEYGFFLMLVIATVFGAVHALTPGHGKTLVAAYLVGQRGTIGHAFLLGLVTTVTHTGAVLLLAAAMYFSESLGQWLLAGITGISFAMGLVMICLAFYLLLLRISGRPDHVHIGGGHHHHHGPGHHHHHGPEHGTEQKLTFWGLVLVGILGGLVPCWDAIFLLLFTIGTSAFWLALPLLTAFSAGLAGTLVAVGVMVVKSRQFAESRWGEGRLVRLLPILSSLMVMALGFWLCFEAVHG